MRRSSCATAIRNAYLGKGVTQCGHEAVNGEIITTPLSGNEMPRRRSKIDDTMIALDGTPNKRPARRQCHSLERLRLQVAKKGPTGQGRTSCPASTAMSEKRRGAAS